MQHLSQRIQQLGLPLRDYQKEDVEFLVKKRRAIIGSEPGTGKTLTALTANHLLNGKRVLVIAIKVALGVWRDEAEKWFNASSIIYQGTPKQRKELREQFVREKPQLLITNYSLFSELLEYFPRWDTIVCDEYHRVGLMNHSTQRVKDLKKFKSDNLFLITGTPVKKGPQDLFAPLHLLHPKQFPSYWQFVHRHCIVFQDTFGKTIEPRPKNVKEFNSMVFQHMVRRLKKDVNKELPLKQRQVLKVQMSPQQAKLYNAIAEDMLAELPQGEMLVTPNAATQVLRLRQILISPQLFGVKSPGGALEALTEHLDTQFDAGRCAVIFTPFKAGIHYIKQYLEQTIKDISIREIHGDMKELASDVAKEFQQDKNKKKVIISTILSGASWTAHAADVAYFVGCEWSAIDNEQAEDRIHRIGQKSKQVDIFYLLYENTVDELVMQRLDEKQTAANWILCTEDMLRMLEKKRGSIKS